ncbi:cobaltochelatase, CobN subunit [Ancylobacter novellus DSM 506]|uniref:Cobaltochelatase, CobN subunit n=1 Tax=Ancylobacter novellus (strain ATCC 8093 / DSM 506 / JCM 20403 / CCM 1077 / IAM 12100 / NBRC 12443 / NCIMB 10456) TaxID=639283 RepID=D7A4K3_ANCN5|nr:cobaltochelatase subunit CobN [Ancylobacter novellus]ADH89866.1 cobaltochelatase, CobN subunit [Ancylobacter novellus DSM 506]
MHILTTTSTSLDDLVEPVDLGQTPGEVVVLSFTDSDLGALARAQQAEPELPSLRLANLRDLRHPMSVDLWIDGVAVHARIVVVRLLGGLDWWRYGVDRLSAEARARGFALAVLPGEDRDDPRLAEASTLPASELEALLAYFRAGGPANMRALLRRLAGHAGREMQAAPPRPVPLAGEYEWERASPSPPNDLILRCSADGRASKDAEAGGAPREHPSRLAALAPQDEGEPGEGTAPTVPVIFYRSMWLAGDTAPVDALCDALAALGLSPRPIFVASLREPASAAFLKDALAAMEPAVIVTLTAFAAADPGEETVLDAPGVPVLQAIVATTKREAWAEGVRGLTSADLAMHVVLPELDGRVLAGALSFKAPEATPAVPGFTALANRPEPDRAAEVAERVAALVRLQATPRDERRVTVLMPDYAGAPGRTGWAVGLNVPASVRALLSDMKAAGYTVEDVPADERDLLDRLTKEHPHPEVRAERASKDVRPGVRDEHPSRPGWRRAPQDEGVLELENYRAALSTLPPAAVAAIHAAWGAPEDDPDLAKGAFRFRAARFGHVTVAIAPDRGSRAERRAQYHDPALPPRHALLAFGLWLQRSSDALVHMGAHGTLEWLPGKHVALTQRCFPELLLGALPVAYPFIVSNPGEAAQAKRRIAAVTLGHLPPPTIEAGLAGEAAELERLVDEYAQADGLDRRRRERLARLIVEEAERTGLARDAGLAVDVPPDEALKQIDAFLCDIKEMRLKDGFHVYGRGPCGQAERDGLLAALDGRRVPAGPAGAPGRGRSDVMPTGRNLFTADPRALPTPTAMDLGRLAADEVLRAYAQAHGDWPRALVLDLWGSATLRTGGEEIAQGLALIGARPTWDPATGRVTGIEVLPTALLGRPRVDVTFRISGLFRDLFPAQIALLDAALRAVARREETHDENPLRAAGEGAPRIFGTAPGAYGAGLEAGEIEREALGAAYLASASHAYGGSEGQAQEAGAAFAARVAAADLLVHGGDDPGRDLLEGDADLAFIGGFAAAAEKLGRTPDLVVLDTSDPARPKARPLAEAIARIVRGRTNPRYIAGLMRHGPRGAAEIAETVDRLVGFAEATRAVPGPLIDALHAAYVGDEAVREFLSGASPEAARFVAARFERARERGLWHPRRNDVSAGLAALAGEAAE